MRQVWISKAGEPDVLEVREAPDPSPGPGEVRVQVEYAGINFADLMARMGIYPDAPKIPCVVGYEVAGTIDAVGSGVSGFQVGDKVVALTMFGGYSSVVVVAATHIVKLPAGIDTKTAAALPVNYLTAWLMLITLGNVKQDDVVLMYSGAGGVGLAALQICKMYGAKYIAVASPSKHDRLTSMGADICVDYREKNIDRALKEISNGRGADIILDSRGGSSYRRSYNRLSPMGRLYLFGVSQMVTGGSRNLFKLITSLMSMPKFKSLKLMDDNRGVMGCNLAHLWDEMHVLGPAFQDIVDLTAKGTFAPVIDSVFSFDDAPESHAHIHARKSFGKVLLEP